MSEYLKQIKNDNIDNIRIGFCIELIVVFSYFDCNFERLLDLISTNSNFLNNQCISMVEQNLNDIQGLLQNFLNILLSDIDNSEKYCDYSYRYY